MKMKKFLFLECSPHGLKSLGAQQVLQSLGNNEARGVQLITRSLAFAPLAPVSAIYAHAVTASAAPDTPAVALSEQLIAELEMSDALLISTPMHNFTVPAALKLWLDHVLRKGRSFTVTPEGKKGLLQDRPTLVLVRSGAPFVGEDARQSDFLTPYLRYALSILGIHDVQFVFLPGLAPTAEALAHAQQTLNAFFDLFVATGELS